MRHLLAAFLIAILALPAPAQLVESIEVRVVNIDVVVTDRDGKPVTGLTRDDFELFEDRKPQKITNFYEVRADQGAPTTTAETRPRRFVFFIDSQSLPPTLRTPVFTSLRNFVDRHLKPGDQASVVNWDRGLKIAAPLMSDPAAIKSAIDWVAAAPSPLAITSDFARVQRDCLRAIDSIRSGRMPPNVAYEECVNTVRSETNAMLTSSRLLANAINVTLTTMTGVEGKKILVLTGVYLPQRPGQEMFQWANQLFVPYMRGFDAPMANARKEEQTQREVIENLGRSASSHGVTMYLIDTLTPLDESVNVQSKNAASGGSADFARLGNTAASYQSLADATGGAAMIRPADFDDAFGRVARDLDSYYSLGYRPAESTRNERAISVRAKNRAYTVRARQSYTPKSPDEQMSERVIANIYTPATSEWQIRLRAGTPKTDGDKFVVPIEVTIPSTLTLLPQGETLAGGFTVYVGVGTPQGALSSMFRSPHPVSTTRAGEADLRKEPLVFTANLTVRPGENLISVAVVDQVTSVTGFARTTVVAGK